MSEAPNVLGPFMEWERASAKGIAQFDALAKAAQDFRTSAEAGNPNYVALERALEAIAKSDAPKAFRDMAAAQSDNIAPMVALQRGMEAEAKAIDKAAVAAARLKQSFAEVRAELAGMIPDLRSEVEKINDAVNEAMYYARSPAEAEGIRRMGEAAKQPLRDAADAALREEAAKRAAVGLSEEAAAIAEVTARYAELIKTHQADTVAVEKYTAAREAAIDTIREQTRYDAGQKAAEEAEPTPKPLARASPASTRPSLPCARRRSI